MRFWDFPEQKIKKIEFWFFLNFIVGLTFVGKLMSLLFNMLSRLVITLATRDQILV